MRGMLTVLALMALAPSSLTAQWNVNGERAPETTWQKADGEFGAMLQLTDKPEEFFKAWEKEGPGVLMSDTSVAKRGVPIVAVVLFAGCAPSDQGLCDSTVTYTVVRPDGKPDGEPQPGELWAGKRPPPKNELQLSIGNMGFVLTADEPLGTYVVRAEVHDLIAKKTLHLERTFEGVDH